GIAKLAAQHDAIGGDVEMGDPETFGIVVGAPPHRRETTPAHAPQLEAKRPALRPRLAPPGEEELDSTPPRGPPLELGHAAVAPGLEEGSFAAARPVETDGAAHALRGETESPQEETVAEGLDAQRCAAPRVAEGVEALADEFRGGVRAAGAEAIEDLAV